MTRTLRKLFLFVFIVMVVYLSLDYVYAEPDTKHRSIAHMKTETELRLERLTDSVTVIRDSLHSEVSGYIRKTAPKSKMTAEHIIGLCEEHEFDITLLLTQGHLETHFGVTNPRNNVFGLYNKRYAHPDSAVIDYIRLMKRRYIVNRTVDEALASNMNVEGSRKYFYSESETYCQHLTKIRNKIIKNTSIKTLFDNLCIINREIEKIN